MFVAVARIAIALPEARSLKGKRQVVHRIVERVRAQFNASIAEVEDNDVWQRAIIGIAVVGNEQGFVQSCIDKILGFIEALYVAPIVSRAVEVVPLGSSLFARPEWEKLEAKIEQDLADERDRDAKANPAPEVDPQERETWPGVRTLADVEGTDDPEMATFRAPAPKSKRGGRAKSIKEMSEAERAQALDALRAQMKRPKDS